MKYSVLVATAAIVASTSAFAQSNGAAIRNQQNIVKKDLDVLRSTGATQKALTDQLHKDQAAASKGDQKAAGRLQGEVNAIAKTNSMLGTERTMLNNDVSKLNKLSTSGKK